MRTWVLAAAAVLLTAGALTGCERAVPGTVAMSTEPGTSTARPTIPRTTQPRTPRTSPPRTPRTAPPSDAESMTCEEYLTLDPDEQTSVIEEILSSEASVLGPGNTEIAKSLADAVCSFLPDSSVSDILTGGGPP